MRDQLLKELYQLKSPNSFEDLALKVFRFQLDHCAVYREYLKLLRVSPLSIQTIEQIPFLPIEVFKSHSVLADYAEPQAVFRSSGTSSEHRSKHFVHDLKLYEWSFIQGFEENFGDPRGYVILALLPSYLERSDSSLVYMVNKLIQRSENPHSGFYLNDLSSLHAKLKELQSREQRVILFTVTFAILDFIDQFNAYFPEVVIIETGGMKGRGKELIRDELYHKIMTDFGVPNLWSEYGMTELLSQAYAQKEGFFQVSHTMRILIRDMSDPFTLVDDGIIGGINVIDLANIDSCSFIATQDIGRTQGNKFEVLGRFDHADIRGCSLMAI